LLFHQHGQHVAVAPIKVKYGMDEPISDQFFHANFHPDWCMTLQCFDAVGWAARSASGL